MILLLVQVGSHVTNMYTNPDQVNYIEKRLQEYVLECDDDELESLFEQNKKQKTLRGELEKTLEAMTEAKQRPSMFL